MMALVGTDVMMAGGLAKVTGAVNYAPDLVLPRMLYAKRCAAHTRTQSFCA